MATSVASFTLCNNPTTYTSNSKTATVSWSAGDVIVVAYACANGDQTGGTPTATGLTFTSRVATAGTSASTDVAIFSATAAASGTSVTVTQTVSGNTDPWCFGVWVITGSPSGVETTGGSTRTTTTGTSTTVSRTTAAGDLVVLVESDWEAAAAGQTLTTGSGTSNKRDNTQSSGQYTYLFGEWVNTGATTASYGATSYSGRRTSTAALVILAAAGGGSVTGTIASTFSLTATAVGQPGVDGTVASTFSLSATAIGTAGKTGTAAATYSLTATAAGAVERTGVALGDLGALTATAVGTPGKAGTAAGTYALTATAAGSVDHGGAIASTFGFTATAVGTPDVAGVIASTFTFTATASQGANNVTGTALGDFGALTATAVGTRGVTGTIATTLNLVTRVTDGTPIIPYSPWIEGVEVGVPVGTTLTTRTSLGSPTSTGTYTLVDPTGRVAGSTIDVDIYEAIEYTTNTLVVHGTTGNARLFRNCRFAILGEATMVQADEEGTGGTSGYMTPRTIFEHCTFDGNATSSKALSGGNIWVVDSHINKCEDASQGPFCSVFIRSNLIAHTDGLADPHADGLQLLSVGKCVVWNCHLSAGEIPGAASQAFRVGVEFGANDNVTVAWSLLEDNAGGWTYQVVGGINTNMGVYDTVILPGGFGPVDFEPGSTLYAWDRVYSDVYGGTPITAPAAVNRTGTISTDFGTLVATATGSGAGGGGVTGTAAAAFTFTATAAGTPDKAGVAAGSFTLTATAAGVRGVTGAIASTFTFSATAGSVRDIPGAAAGTFTLTATAVGTPDVAGAATSSFGGLTATAAGTAGKAGSAAGTLTVTAVATGIRGVTGVALGAFGTLVGTVATVPPASAQVLTLALDSYSNALALDSYANTLELTT